MNAPAASCTLSKAGTVVDVPVSGKCRVLYTFDTRATSKDLAIPYVYTLNGCLPRPFDHGPRLLDRESRQFALAVDPGTRIELFLNSDACYRTCPVYALQAGAHDVEVNVIERPGRGANEQRPVLGVPATLSGPRKPVDKYSAVLTGDTWMAISHLYTPAEADALLPAETPAIVREAIHVIYSGLPGAELTITFPSHRLRLRFRDEMTDNVRANTTHCPLQTGIIPRTHPGAFAALIMECRAVGIHDVAITSAWRPMLGSIAHRAGLGLDVNYIETATTKLALNRASLIKDKSGGNNVSAKEAALYAEFAHANRELNAAQKEADNTRRAIKVVKDPGLLAKLHTLFASAIGRVKQSMPDMVRRKNAWSETLASDEPALIHNLRERLDKNPHVSQTFDPWYMEPNTRDAVAATLNAQLTGNEKIHNNHLHITVAEPRILP